MINISIFDSVESNALCLSKTTEKTLVPEAQWSFKIFVYYANMLSRKNPSDTFKHQLFDKEVTKSSRKTKVSITLKKVHSDTHMEFSSDNSKTSISLAVFLATFKIIRHYHYKDGQGEILSLYAFYKKASELLSGFEVWTL